MHTTREENNSYKTHSTYDPQNDTVYEPFEDENEIQHHVNIEGEPMILRSIEPKDEKEIVTEYKKWKGNRLPNKVGVKPVAAGKKLDQN